jgi:diguanylate cyclase (GGDEF)-like protein
MVEVEERQSIDDALRLATDLCLALGAFAVGLTGVVRHYVSEAVAPDDVARRMERLARSCLVHPAAHGRELFWNAEVSTDTGFSDRSLACAVLPVWHASTQIGLLGIVDTWLPEPDDDQRAGLVALGAELARSMQPLAGGESDAVGTHAAAEPASGPSAPPAGEGDVTPAVPSPRRAVTVSPSGVWSTDTVPSAWPPGSPGGTRPPDGAPAAPLLASPDAQVDAADLVAAFEDAVICLDGGGTVVLANRAADLLYGLDPAASLVGSPLPEQHAFRREDGAALVREEHPALLVLRDGVARALPVLVGESEGQRRFTLSARVFTVAGGGGALVVMHDTTAEWMEQQRLSRYAMYDPLTGLANRYLLEEELRRMLQGLGRRGGSVSLVYLDLDKFKLINDEHGHDMGDEVLGAVARRLRGAVRGDDVVARLGGDEFVIAHASAESRPDGDLVVSRLRKVLCAPFRVRGHAFDVGASIGWVSTDRGDLGPEALLARADRAMYQSKRDRAARRPPQ